MKEFRYIGQDPQKQGWIAKYIEEQKINTHYRQEPIWIKDCYIIETNSSTNNICRKELIENEPTLREEIEEDNIWQKIVKCYSESNNEYPRQDMEFAIKKSLGISREELNECFISGSYVDTRPKIEKLFSNRGLLLD